MDEFYEECILISSKFFIIFLLKKKTFSFEMHIKIVCRMGGSCCCLNLSRSSRVMDLLSPQHIFCWRPRTNESCLSYVVLFVIEQGEKYGEKPCESQLRGLMEGILIKVLGRVWNHRDEELTGSREVRA